MPRFHLKQTTQCFLFTITFSYLFCLGLNWLNNEDEFFSSWFQETFRYTINGRPLFWFMSNVSIAPESWLKENGSHLWPEDRSVFDDGIVAQLMYYPQRTPKKPKLILVYDSTIYFNHLTKKDKFLHCPVSNCKLTTDYDKFHDADAILFTSSLYRDRKFEESHQVWIYYHLESPANLPTIYNPNIFNWTATYRRDSDIVTPYEKWVYYNKTITQFNKPQKNFAANKTRKVAWFVSNCKTMNHRLEYAKELQRYIDVDIFGFCGTKKCPKFSKEKCFQMLEKEYKFYLAFENSNCMDYITEKFFVNGLGHNVIPIAMGARPEDYKRSAPDHSYIHVDEFPSPKHLAKYLHKLDQNDDLYNSYFKWKGTGEFINTHFFCRLCALLHVKNYNKHYKDINRWLKTKKCTHGSWRQRYKKL